MKRKEFLIKQLKLDLSTLNDYIKDFDDLEDWKIEKKVNEIKGFFEGFRFCQRYYDREIIRTNEELEESKILNQTYPEFNKLWNSIEEKFKELEKMMLLNDEDEAWYIAEDEKEKLKKNTNSKNY